VIIQKSGKLFQKPLRLIVCFQVSEVGLGKIVKVDTRWGRVFVLLSSFFNLDLEVKGFSLAFCSKAAAKRPGSLSSCLLSTRDVPTPIFLLVY